MMSRSFESQIPRLPAGAGPAATMAAKGWREDERVQELTKTIRAPGRQQDVLNLIARLTSLLGPDADEQIAEYAWQNSISAAVVPLLDKEKLMQYCGVKPSFPAHPDDVNAEIRASSDAMRARGGLSAAVDALCSGPLDEDILLATKSLAGLLDDADAPDQLARCDVVRVILLTVECPGISHFDLYVLGISVQRLITQCQGFAEALLEAYSDPDARVAFSALTLSIHAVQCEPACAALRKAGLVRAVMAALSHPSAYCRTEAVLLCAGRNKELLADLRDAEVVLALVKLLYPDNDEFEGERRGSPSTSGVSCTGYFTRCGFELRGASGASLSVGLRTPRFAVCTTLSVMEDNLPDFAVEMVAAPGFAPSLVQSCFVFPNELLLGPTRLLAKAVKTLRDCPRHEALRRPFAEELVSAGLLETLPRLVNPALEALGDHVFDALTTIVEWAGYVCVPADSLPLHTALLLDFMRTSKEHAGSALALLKAMSFAGFQSQPCHRGPSALQLSEALVNHLARFVNVGQHRLAAYAVPVILRRAQDAPALLDTAVDAGFIPGMLRILMIVGEGEADEAQTAMTPEEEEAFTNAQKVISRGVVGFLSRAKESHVMEALTSGLVAEFEAGVARGTPTSQELCMRACGVLLVRRDLPGAAAKLREAGVMPGLLLKVAESSKDVCFVALAAGLRVISREKLERAREFVVELLAAGVLDKLMRSLLKLPNNHLRTSMSSSLQILHRFAQQHQSEIRSATSRPTGDGVASSAS